MGVSRAVLLAGMQQLSQKYRGKGIDRITVQVVAGKPLYVMQGATVYPPPDLPGRITVPDTSGKPALVPIMWSHTAAVLRGEQLGADWMYAQDKPVTPLPKSDEVDVDRSMWRGFTPIERRDVVVEYQPGREEVITAGEIPKADVTELQVSVDTTGEWGWWTKPFDVYGCLCCTFYQTPTTVFRYVVPPDYALYVDAWAFFVNGVLPVGETFNVRFLRDGETLLEYDEVIVDPGNPDPARRCLFSGSIEQIQHSWLRIDRNQTLSVVLTPKGLAPFLKGPLDTFCATICVLLHGHLEALLDNRDGAPRPKDVGRLRDDLWGTATLDEVSQADVDQLLTWIDGASANAAPTNEAAGGDIAPGLDKAPGGDIGPGTAVVGGGAILTALVATALLSGEGSSVSPNPLS